MDTIPAAIMMQFLSDDPDEYTLGQRIINFMLNDEVFFGEPLPPRM
jgi:hypothetical protein